MNGFFARRRWRLDFLEELTDLMDETHRVDVSERLILRAKTPSGVPMWEALRRGGWHPWIAAQFVVMAPQFTELRMFWVASTHAVAVPDLATGMRYLAEQSLSPVARSAARQEPAPATMWQRGGKVFWKAADGRTHFAPAHEFDDLSDIPERP